MTTIQKLTSAAFTHKALIFTEGTKIGVRFTGKRNWTTYWFEVFEENVIFSHSYNQNNRKIKRTLISNWSALEKLSYFK